MSNYFTLFSLPASFTVDAAALESAYFKLQRQYHPDRFVKSPAAEKHAAAETSVQVNEAYRTLKEPLPRARYLLSLEGILVGTDRDTVKPESRILTESMTLREAMETGQNIAPQLQALRAQCLADLTSAFEKRALAEAAQHVFRLIYVEKALEESQKRVLKPAI